MPKRRHATGQGIRPLKRRIRRKRSTKRRIARFKRKGGNRIPRVLLNRVFQPKIQTVLTYCDTKTLDPGTGATDHEWHVNDIFDPDSDGVGHQPMFRDNFASWYNKYRVLGMSYEVTFVGSATVTEQKATHVGATDTYPLTAPERTEYNRLVGVEWSDDGTSPRMFSSSDKNTLREVGGMLKNVKWGHLSGPAKSRKFKGYISTKMADDSPAAHNATTTMGSGPTDPIKFWTCALSPDGNDAWSVLVHIKFKYYVEFSDLKMDTIFVEN